MVDTTLYFYVHDKYYIMCIPEAIHYLGIHMMDNVYIIKMGIKF